MIRELREENEKLKKLLYSAANGGIINLKDLGNLEEIQETMEENVKAMEDLEKPWEQKLQEEKDKDKGVGHYSKDIEKDRKIPHLTNLNEDPQLSNKVYYSLLDCKIIEMSLLLFVQVLSMWATLVEILNPI